MRKKCMKLICVLALTGCLVGCGNRDILDTQFTFNYVNITLQTGEVISGKVQSWRDYDDGEQLQIKVNDVIYLVHSSNVDLIYKPE